MTPAQYPHVGDECPFCHGRTLFLGEGGFVTCSYISCPHPDTIPALVAARKEAEAVIERLWEHPEEALRATAAYLTRRTGATT